MSYYVSNDVEIYDIDNDNDAKIHYHRWVKSLVFLKNYKQKNFIFTK